MHSFILRHISHMTIVPQAFRTSVKFIFAFSSSPASLPVCRPEHKNQATAHHRCLQRTILCVQSPFIFRSLFHTLSTIYYGNLYSVLKPCSHTVNLIWISISVDINFHSKLEKYPCSSQPFSPSTGCDQRVLPTRDINEYQLKNAWNKVYPEQFSKITFDLPHSYDDDDEC